MLTLVLTVAVFAAATLGAAAFVAPSYALLFVWPS